MMKNVVDKKQDAYILLCSDTFKISEYNEMANVKPNPILNELDRVLDNIVFFSRYKKQYSRVYVKPANPDTVYQKTIRGIPQDVKSWKELPESEI